MIKAIFIGLMPIVCLAMIGGAAMGLANGGDVLTGVGVIVANTPLPVIIGLILTGRFARMAPNLPAGLGVAVAGLVMACVGSAMAGLGLQPIAQALTGAVGTFAYVFWYSRLDRSASRLVIGEPLPAFSIPDADGVLFTPDRLREATHLLLFFRGNWCPLCMAQIKEIAAQYRQIAQRGARIVLVSPQPPGHTQKLADRFDVPFIYLVDADFKAAHALGLFHKNGLPMGFQALGYDSDTVLPTVIITDADGVVRHLDQSDNYRARPEPDTFLAALDAVGG